MQLCFKFTAWYNSAWGEKETAWCCTGYTQNELADKFCQHSSIQQTYHVNIKYVFYTRLLY